MSICEWWLRERTEEPRREDAAAVGHREADRQGRRSLGVLPSSACVGDLVHTGAALLAIQDDSVGAET